MKTLIAFLSVAAALAQGIPPIVTTNLVRLSQPATLMWTHTNRTADVAGYWVTMEHASVGTNVWRSFTTNMFMDLYRLNTNIQTGRYVFSVRSVNTNGTESVPATMTENIDQMPGAPDNLIIKQTIILEIVK